MEKNAAGQLINLRMQMPSRYRTMLLLAFNANSLGLRRQQ